MQIRRQDIAFSRRPANPASPALSKMFHVEQSVQELIAKGSFFPLCCHEHRSAVSHAVFHAAKVAFGGQRDNIGPTGAASVSSPLKTFRGASSHAKRHRILTGKTRILARASRLEPPVQKQKRASENV